MLCGPVKLSSYALELTSSLRQAEPGVQEHQQQHTCAYRSADAQVTELRIESADAGSINIAHKSKFAGCVTIG